MFQYLCIADKEEAVILETFEVQVVSSDCISSRSLYLVGYEAVLSLPIDPLPLEKHWEKVMTVYSRGSRYSVCIVRGDV